MYIYICMHEEIFSMLSISSRQSICQWKCKSNNAVSDSSQTGITGSFASASLEGASD